MARGRKPGVPKGADGKFIKKDELPSELFRLKEENKNLLDELQKQRELYSEKVAKQSMETYGFLPTLQLEVILNEIDADAVKLMIRALKMEAFLTAKNPDGKSVVVGIKNMQAIRVMIECIKLVSPKFKQMDYSELKKTDIVNIVWPY